MQSLGNLYTGVRVINAMHALRHGFYEWWHRGKSSTQCTACGTKCKHKAKVSMWGMEESWLLSGKARKQQTVEDKYPLNATSTVSSRQHQFSRKTKRIRDVYSEINWAPAYIFQRGWDGDSKPHLSPDSKVWNSHLTKSQSWQLHLFPTLVISHIIFDGNYTTHDNIILNSYDKSLR